MKHMVTLDYKLMLSLSLWQYNHHPDEGLTSGLFQKTFGPVDGKHYYEKWTGYFNRNLWDMIAYFRGEGENGQKFCDMIAAQVELYTKNRSNHNLHRFPMVTLYLIFYTDLIVNIIVCFLYSLFNVNVMIRYNVMYSMFMLETD